MVVGLLKSTLSVEVDKFFSCLGTDEVSPTKSALVQARQKLLPKFFKDLFQFGVALFYRCFRAQRWKAMRLWAADGTGFRLPDEQRLGEEFGWHGRVPSTRLLCHYDLLDSLVTSVQFHPHETAETVVAQRSIAQIPKDACVVYDRGYASHTIPFLHQLHGPHCIIRMPVGFSNTVRDFVASGKKQRCVTENLSPKSRQVLQSLGLQVNIQDTIAYHLIRVVPTTLLYDKRFRLAIFPKYTAGAGAWRPVLRVFESGKSVSLRPL